MTISNSNGAPDVPPFVQGAIQHFMKNTSAPGVAGAIVSPTTGPMSFAYGERMVATDTFPALPLHVDSVFCIGSVTKVFTSTLLMYEYLFNDSMECPQPNLALMNPSLDWLGPVIKEKCKNNAEMQAVTLLQLATNTSGMPQYIPDMGTRIPGVWLGRSPQEWMIDQWVNVTTQNPNEFSYSNFGFVTLAFNVVYLGNLLIQNNPWTLSYNDLLEMWITEPTGMLHTSLNVIGDDVVMGYTDEDFTQPHEVSSGHDLNSTANDLMIFIQNCLNAGPDPDSPLISALTATYPVPADSPPPDPNPNPSPDSENGGYFYYQTQGHQQPQDHWLGLAWITCPPEKKINGYWVFEKGGISGRAGCTSNISLIPELGIGVALLCNQRRTQTVPYGTLSDPAHDILSQLANMQ